jgi:hypothetical protein
MPSTYTPIATNTLTTGASSVTFSSIPSIYTDLIFVVNAQQGAGGPIYVRVNGSSSSIYSTTSLRASSTTVTSLRFNATGSGIDGLGVWVQDEAFPDSSTFGIITYHFMNYSNTTTNKTVLIRYNNATTNPTAFVGTNASLIQTTSAISSLEIRNGGVAPNFAIGSTFTLYGIKAA